MRLSQAYRCDVLVIGSGIAGISAALEAAELGRSVMLVSSTRIFSGSSFYPGTWGLGLIGPADEGDQADLARTIAQVGCGMADPVMVDRFVRGIHPAIEKVRRMGVRLRRAGQGEQREYVPCFDHKHRDWNGIEFDSAREVFSRRMEELGIVTLPGHALLELVQAEGRVCGAVLAEGESPVYVGCGALVLATGGYGGLFQYHLCTEDITGVGQALALKAGCRLTNLEFMQMMPGYLRPAPKTIYNEKVFRFTRFQDGSGALLFPDTDRWRELLALRSTHGPFTSRLASREIDLRLFDAFLADEGGVRATYTEEMRENPPEFVRVYFDWLRESKGLTMEDPIQLGIFAHAANGGIRIDPEGATGVPGLFACGEVTGGMHGADRIGGLSTANGLVFGGIAGRSAAQASLPERGPETWAFSPRSVSGGETALRTLRSVMFRGGMMNRTEQGLTDALARIETLERELTPVSDGGGSLTEACRLENQLLTARAILTAALLRRESRGSHFRRDYPEPDPALARPVEVTWEQGTLRARFKEE